MKKETLLIIAVAALLVLNFGILGYLFVSNKSPALHSSMPPARPSEMPPPMGKRTPFDNLIVTRLHLTEAQEEQFTTLKQEHRMTMERYDSEYRRTLERYFSLLQGASIDAVRQDSLQKILANIHIQKVSYTLRHFAALKNICSPEQQALFAPLIPELSHVLTQPPRKPRPERPNDAPNQDPNQHRNDAPPPERRN